MSATPSTMIPLGTQAPDFSLIDVKTNKMLSLGELKSEIATVVMFICNHCPFVIHINNELVKFADEYISKGISFIAINANDIENYPDDSPENMKQMSKQMGYPFSYFFDSTQEVAKSFKATCTPDFFIFDKDLKLVYRGQFDDSRPGNTLKTDGKDIRIALDNVLAERPVDVLQKPSIGCNIKWKYGR